MRRKSPYHILLLPLLLCMMTVASCGSRSVMRELESIESILDDSPDSVRSRLDRIDASSLHGESRALYAMLRTQADYKCYVDIPGDSLIRQATSYYGTRRKSWRAAMSWYLLGCVNDLCGRDTVAIEAYLYALNLFPDTLVRSYAMCEHNLGQNYMNHHFDERALCMFRNCKINATRLQDTAMAVYCDYNMATALMYQEKYSQADSIFNSVLRSARPSASLAATICRELAKIQLYGYGDSEAAMRYIEESLASYGLADRSGAEYNIMADIYYSENRPDSAYAYYIKSLSCIESNLQTRCNTYRRLSALAAMLGRTEESADNLEKYCATLVQVYEEYHQSSIYDIQSRHRDELQRLYLTNVRRNTVIACLLLMVLLVVAIAFLYRRRVRLIKDAYQQEYNEALSNLKRSKTEEIGFRLQSDINSFRRSPAYILIKEISESKRDATPTEIAIVEQALTETFQDIIVELHHKAPRLKTDEISYCLLSAIGLNSTQCGYILCYYANLRMLKKRVKSKMPDELICAIFNESVSSNS